MKYLDEYRDPQAARNYASAIASLVKHNWSIMEVCGGQTHSIVRYGLDTLLPKQVTLLHGPGCPVCVTPVEKIDTAVAIASRSDTILCSYGDMLRVPGSNRDLLSVKACGGDVRIVYSPMDALKIAENHPDKKVVFFAVGFETTAPANAMAVFQARRLGITNFSMLVSHVLVPPAIEAILEARDSKVDGFLAAGHVCTVMGWQEYIPISQRYRVPIVVTGFEPLDILQGIHMCLKQLEEGRAEVENQYTRSVRPHGNTPAIRMVESVFQVTSRKWRGIGEIAASGLRLRDEYMDFDAERLFPLEFKAVEEDSRCLSGMVLQGLKKPNECPQFGTTCTPQTPLGATMVSSEGACAAYYRYKDDYAR